MKLKHFIVFGLLLIAGAAGGVLLVTSESEVALIHFRDKNFDTALKQYESRLSAGDSSVSVVMPLCELYLQYGNVDSAIALMQRYVRENPSDVEARLLLSRYFQYAQRQDEYLHALEAVAVSSPSENIQRQLSDIYRFRGQLDKQIEVLRTITIKYPGHPDDFLNLANIQAAQSKLSDAVATLGSFEAAHPKSITAETVQFFVSVLLDSGQADRAAVRAKQWLTTNPNPETAARIASLLSSRREHQKALALLQPFEAAADRNSEVLEALTQIEILNMKEDRALARLDRLYEASMLPDSVLEPYLDLLLTKNEASKAFEVGAKRDLRPLPNWLLSNLARASLDQNRLDFTRYLIGSAGASFLEEYPVLGAREALSRGDLAAAEVWIDKAHSSKLTKEEQMELASIHTDLGQTESAVRLLERLAEDPQTTEPAIRETAIRDLASLYLDTGQAGRGLPLFRRLRKSVRSPELHRSWALLEASAGREKDVVEWLQMNERGSQPDFFENLFFVANDTGKKDLALASAQRLYRSRGRDQDRLHLSESLYASGMPWEALDHLRVLVAKGYPEAEALYAEALSAAEKNGFPARGELQAFWSKKLNEAGLDAEKQEEAAQVLLDLEAYDTVLPTVASLARRAGGSWRFAYVETAAKANHRAELLQFLHSELKRTDLAENEKDVTLELLREYGTDTDVLPYVRERAEARGGDWAFAYEEMLERIGKRADLVAFWQKRVALPNTPIEEKREIAFRSLDAGEKSVAEDIFWSLAQDAPAGSPLVSQLLFIWGPRPKPAGLDWLETRARNSSGAEKAAWVEHLINAGAATRAVKAFREDEIDSLRFRALVAAGNASDFARTIERTLPATNDPAVLRKLGESALELNIPAAVHAVYSKLLSIEPEDPEALRRVGSLDYAEGRAGDAKDKLGRYLEQTEGDAESHFYYGELLQQEGKAESAKRHFAKALAQIEGSGEKTVQMRTIHALSLHYVGRVNESFAEFDNLIKEHPGNKNLRADYAAVLMQSGRHDDAQHLLDLP